MSSSSVHAFAFVAVLGGLQASPQMHGVGSAHFADEVEVVILSTNLADGSTIGEWGLSALVKVDGRCMLFDAGRYPETAVANARTLGVDLSCVTDIVLSHFHFDHTTGLLPLMREIRSRNPQGFQRIHVATGFFLPRRIPLETGDAESNQMIAMKDSLTANGVTFIEYAEPTEIFPSVWVTGPVPRPHPERNYPQGIEVLIDGQWVEDYVPDDQGLTIITPHGHVVLLGCGHTGVVNMVEFIVGGIQSLPVHALIGGLHLYAAGDDVIDWTVERLRPLRVENLIAAHCTGIEALLELREGLDLTRGTAVVGAVGGRFIAGEGIRPGAIAM